MPKLRVDFIFYFFPQQDDRLDNGRGAEHRSSDVSTHTTSGHNTNNDEVVSILSAGVIDNNDTKKLSDHFPVHLSFNQKENNNFNGV